MDRRDPTLETNRASREPPRRHKARFAFLLLVIIPFLPEILIWAAATIAELKGCQPDQKDACLIGTLPVSDIIAFSLYLGAGLIIAGVRASYVWLVVACGAMAGWLVACYAALILGWARVSSRLLLGFAVAAVFAFLPYFGPMLSVANLVNEHCRPNDGGVGACMMFGSYVGKPEASPAHDAVMLGWLAPYGALLALAIFAVYAVVVIVIAIASAKRTTAAV